VTHQENGAVDLVDHAPEVLAVAAGQSAQRDRRGDHRDVFAAKHVVQPAKARCVSERAMDKDDRGLRISHE
jgi:hypothetical protein